MVQKCKLALATVRMMQSQKRMTETNKIEVPRDVRNSNETVTISDEEAGKSGGGTVSDTGTDDRDGGGTDTVAGALDEDTEA